MAHEAAQSVDITTAGLPPAYQPPAPPSYANVSSNPAVLNRPGPAEEDLHPTEYAFDAYSKTKPWATLRLTSNHPNGILEGRTSTRLPTYFEGEPITGSLQVAEDRWDKIDSVHVSLKGSILTGVTMDAAIPFVDIPHILWTRSSKKDPTKTDGNITLPISIALPKEVILKTKPNEEAKVYRLPPTLSERHTKSSVQYELTVTIRKKGMLRGDSKITTLIGYVPKTFPGPMSRKRIHAYTHATSLPGPEEDPDGWYIRKLYRVKGTLFDSRPLEMTCTFALAKPLSYTRGSVIPCTLLFTSPDVQALDLLSSPNAIFVRLRRVLSYIDDKSAYARPVGTFPRNEWQDYDLAVWWPAIENRNEKPDLHKRRMDGEIALAPDLLPSASTAHFTITYSVVLFPFDARGFTPTTLDELAVEPVEIVTSFSPGPKPIAYAPPDYTNTWASSSRTTYISGPSSSSNSNANNGGGSSSA